MFLLFLGMPRSKSIEIYSYQVVEDLMVTLNTKGVAAQITFFHDKPWIRLSAQVYNCSEDYIQLREKMTEIFDFE